jgi:hypothetical protein
MKTTNRSLKSPLNRTIYHNGYAAIGSPPTRTSTLSFLVPNPSPVNVTMVPPAKLPDKGVTDLISENQIQSKLINVPLVY